MTKILKYEDILKITEFLNENGYSDYGIIISTQVPDKQTLDKVNEDFFYRIRGDGNEETPEYGDVINISVKGITYRYTVRDKEEQR